MIPNLTVNFEHIQEIELLLFYTLTSIAPAFLLLILKVYLRLFEVFYKTSMHCRFFFPFSLFLFMVTPSPPFDYHQSHQKNLLHQLF